MKTFWRSVAWFINHVGVLCLASYLLGAVAMFLMPALQIYGPDPLRVWLADHLGGGSRQALQFAGAILDFKKLIPYVVLSMLIISYRTVLRYRLGQAGRNIDPTTLSNDLRVAKGWKVLQVALLTISTVLLVERLVMPSRGSHIFGLTGVGLLSHWTAPLSLWHHIVISIYRLTYLPLLAALYWTGSLVLPAYLRACLVGNPLPSEVFGKDRETELLAVLLQLFIVPASALASLIYLFGLTRTFGVGFLRDEPGLSAIVAAIIVFTWIVVGLWWLFRQAPVAGDPFFRLAALIIRAIGIYGLVVAVASLLAAAAGVFFIRGIQPSAMSLYRAAVINRCSEYCDWRLDESQQLLRKADSLAAEIDVPEYAAERSRFWHEVLGFEAADRSPSAQDIQTFLAAQIVIRSMWKSSFDHDGGFRHYVESASLGAGTTWTSARSWLVSIDPKTAEGLVASLADSAEVIRRSGWFFDRESLRFYRWSTLRKLSRDFQKPPLSGLGWPMFVRAGQPVDSALASATDRLVEHMARQLWR
jgi:hypothetical protein